MYVARCSCCVGASPHYKFISQLVDLFVMTDDDSVIVMSMWRYVVEVCVCDGGNW